MKQKLDRISTSKLVTYALIGLISLLGLVCFYYGSIVAPAISRSERFFDGADPVHSGFTRTTTPDLDDLVEDSVPQSFPVCSTSLYLDS